MTGRATGRFAFPGVGAGVGATHPLDLDRSPRSASFVAAQLLAIPVLLRSGVGSKQLLLDMQVVGDAPPTAFATAVPAMFEALLDVFAPLDVAIQIDAEPMQIARIDPVRTFGTDPLWCDEELTRDPLTRCRPTLGTDVVAELYERLAGIAPAAVSVTAIGAVHHRAPGTDAPAWYGRWRGTGVQALATIAFRWTGDPWRGFGLRCPLGGYPFTATRPLARGIGDGDPTIAAQNRALWLPALCRVRAALGFDRSEVAWTADGDCDARERAAVRKDWLPRLRES